jgi:hypothetical protein
MTSAAKTRFMQGMAIILGELETLYAEDKIGGVMISIVRRDHDIRTLNCYDEGFKLPLVTAATIAQHELVASLGREPDPDNWQISEKPKGDPA